MIPSRIQKVLSTLANRQVQALLMGGQACVFYGAAEFSRDADLLVLTAPDNLQRLRGALEELQAECVAVPPFAAEFLERGHAVHFRCHHPDATGLRVDVMARLRGGDPFPVLWQRRTTITDSDGTVYELLALQDLVLAKKTQRGKDWPMVRRLLEAHYLQHREAPGPEMIPFWLRELQTPEFLIEAVERWPEEAARLRGERPLLDEAARGAPAEVERALLMRNWPNASGTGSGGSP